MPEPIDWPGIRANAVLVGVRLAARQAGRELPPIEQHRFVKRVLKRSEREGWITRKTEVEAATRLEAHQGYGKPAKPLSSPVATAPDATAKALIDDGLTTKTHLVQAVKKAAVAFEAKTGENVIKQAKNLKEIVSSAATLHGWQEKGDAGVHLNIALVVNQAE